MNPMNAQPPNAGKLINCQQIPAGKLPANTVFIDKGSPWENPFTIGIHGDREEIVTRYELLLAHTPEKLEELDFLQGKDLTCFCAPLKCHGTILLHLAAMPYRQRLEWAEQVKQAHAREDQILLAA